MNRNDRAIGFAVYTDMLERLYYTKKEYDTDILFLYGNSSDFGKVTTEAEKLREMGNSVLVMNSIPENIRYKMLIKADGVNI